MFAQIISFVGRISRRRVFLHSGALRNHFYSNVNEWIPHKAKGNIYPEPVHMKSLYANLFYIQHLPCLILTPISIRNFFHSMEKFVTFAEQQICRTRRGLFETIKNFSNKIFRSLLKTFCPKISFSDSKPRLVLPNHFKFNLTGAYKYWHTRGYNVTLARFLNVTENGVQYNFKMNTINNALT